mmetsp:Transcript_43188/g.84652  ORF Transcript_43188/g.84652 Transcript_43188/m.84652 type:complete len:438 (+) Transcript_43188:3-1316(+)
MIVIFCSLLLHLASGRIQDLDIENDDRSTIHINSFGFDKGGVLNLTVTDLQLKVPHDFQAPADEMYDIAFLLQRSVSDAGARADFEDDGTCFHSEVQDDTEVIGLRSRNDWKYFNHVSQIEQPGYYHLYFSNCEKTSLSSFHMDLIQYNVVPESGAKDYLSTGEKNLPTWLFLICIMFLLELVLWTLLMWTERPNVRSIHLLMTAVLVLKIFTLFFEGFKYHSMKIKGHNDGWTYAFYVFSFAKGIMMFTVIVLIGTGWSYLKPFLTDRDKQIMIGVLVAQLLVNIAMVIVDESAHGSSSWLTWREVLLALDMLCCCAILLPIVWSIRHLRGAAGADGKDGQCTGQSRNLDRLKAFRSFYLVVVSYVYFTRIVVFLLTQTLPVSLAWLSTVFSEAAALAFYAVTGYLFRPQSVNPYLALDKDGVEHELADLSGSAEI